MNPPAGLPPSLQLQPPQPPQLHRSSFSCDRHPDENFTGFCPSCLCERLSGLDHVSSTVRKNGVGIGSSAAAAALKALFKGAPATSGYWNHRKSTGSKPQSADLRRCKSFSASKGDRFPGILEPQRRSCDVRGGRGTTLCSLFTQADAHKLSISSSVIESKGETIENDHVAIGCPSDRNEIETEEPRVSSVNAIEGAVNEIEEEKFHSETKTMKDYIDLDSRHRKPPSSAAMAGLKAGSGFWSAASVFSKKLQKWRQKQKVKKRETAGAASSSSARVPLNIPAPRKLLRDTQSEVADYGFGRRSCDTDPRVSVDAGMASFDDFRYSFDEPRASWDGYSIGKTFQNRLPPMLSVVEDDRPDTQIPVEKPQCSDEDDGVPGGTAQTRDYYSDSSSRRRKSLDRSSSIRKTAAAIVAEIDEIKALSNSKVTPETTEYVHGLNSSDCNGGSKKPSGWKKGWNLWGFIYSRWTGGKDAEEEDEGRFARLTRGERSLSESWPEFRRTLSNRLKTGSNQKVPRSNSSVSFRNSGSFDNGRRSCVEFNQWKRRDGGNNGILERNRSARFSSPTNAADGGLWRFYMTTPLKGSRKTGPAKSRPNSSHSVPRSVLRLY